MMAKWYIETMGPCPRPAAYEVIVPGVRSITGTASDPQYLRSLIDALDATLDTKADTTTVNTKVTKEGLAAIPAPSTTGVTSPAAVIYDQTGQTALINAVLAEATAINSIRTALQTVGITL